MAQKSKEFIIEIGRLTKLASAGLSPDVQIIGLVPNKPGEYLMNYGMRVEVCQVISKSKHPDIQKIILMEEGCRRRVAMVHHNASKPILQDLSFTESLVFRRR